MIYCTGPAPFKKTLKKRPKGLRLGENVLEFARTTQDGEQESEGSLHPNHNSSLNLLHATPKSRNAKPTVRHGWIAHKENNKLNGRAAIRNLGYPPTGRMSGMTLKQELCNVGALMIRIGNIGKY